AVSTRAAERFIVNVPGYKSGVRRPRRRFGSLKILPFSESKAVSRFACHRTPNRFFINLLDLPHQVAQFHFSVSCLEAAFHRGPHSSLVLRSAHTFEEEIGVALNVFSRSESDRIDSILDHGVAGGWKTGNPKRKRSYKIA